EAVDRAGDVGPALLPPATAADACRAVEGIEVRVRRRVDAAGAGVRICRVGEVALAEGLHPEGGVVGLASADVRLESRGREVVPVGERAGEADRLRVQQ